MVSSFDIEYGKSESSPTLPLHLFHLLLLLHRHLLLLLLLGGVKKKTLKNPTPFFNVYNLLQIKTG